MVTYVPTSSPQLLIDHMHSNKASLGSYHFMASIIKIVLLFLWPLFVHATVCEAAPHQFQRKSTEPKKTKFHLPQKTKGKPIQKRSSIEALKRKTLEPELSTIHKDQAASPKNIPNGQIQLSSGKFITTSEINERAKIRYKKLKKEKKKTLQTKNTLSERRVIISGGGPAGLLAAIQAYHLGMQVVIVEKRESNELPVIWNNRQQTRDILFQIDPVLAKRVFDTVATPIQSVHT